MHCHVFQKCPWGALNGAGALNRANMVVPCLTIYMPVVSESRQVFYQWLGQYSDIYCWVG